MDTSTWGMNEFKVTLQEFDKRTQTLTISFREDDGSDVVHTMNSGINNHFSKDFLKLFNIEMEKRNA
tara:strand:- start:292 stop:492 length:201 start_codon:yes stop_codon:yes gene_type:complete